MDTVQFHQSYSYEDFVQGYRPDGKGGFTLRDGVFHRFCEKANLSPGRPHVFIIDEINRGNLAKILGELMLLIEHDKRGPSWATTLTYSEPGEPLFFVPENLYLLGMMNTADRSLSIVDYALRRRFSFALLEPMFASAKFRDLLLSRGVPDEIVTLIITRMTALNKAIGEDRANLGPGYRIGHSFFVPPEGFEYDPAGIAASLKLKFFRYSKSIGLMIPTRPIAGDNSFFKACHDHSYPESLLFVSLCLGSISRWGSSGGRN